jgi:hypothetical protein
VVVIELLFSFKPENTTLKLNYSTKTTTRKHNTEAENISKRTPRKHNTETEL